MPFPRMYLDIAREERNLKELLSQPLPPIWIGYSFVVTDWFTIFFPLPSILLFAKPSYRYGKKFNPIYPFFAIRIWKQIFRVWSKRRPSVRCTQSTRANLTAWHLPVAGWQLPIEEKILHVRLVPFR